MWLLRRLWLVVTPKARLWKKQKKNIKEAIELYLESLAAHGERIPQENKSFQGRVEIPVSFKRSLLHSIISDARLTVEEFLKLK